MKLQKAVKKVLYKMRLLVAAILLVGAQAIAPISLLIPDAAAAPICVVDTAGANDEPGQKDLNKLCVDYAGVPTTVNTTWNWDETGTSGANTMDACNLFDTDGDGNINYAVCVTTQNDPAALQSTTTYSCGDTKIDRCTSPATPISSGTTACSVSQVTNDPFPGPPASAKGDSYPKDTQGACAVQLSTVGGASAKLIDVCSYPSAQPNSDPSDCVIARSNAGKVEVIKDIVPNSDTGLFNLTIDGSGANDDITVNNVGDNGTTGEKVVTAGSVTVKETAGTNTQLTNYSTTIVCKDLNGTGTIVGQGSPTGTSSRQLTFTLVDDADVVCTITNTRQQATLVLQKTVVNDNGGTLTQSNFPVAISGNTAQWGSNTVNPGSYTVSETQQAGYAAGAWGGDCDAQGNVTLTTGQTKTCTITNNDVAGQMKVVKHVVNDNGGSAVAGDFILSVNGQAKTQNQYFSASVGTYTVTESGPSGYTQTGLVCVDDNTQQTVAHPVSLALAQSVTCTVTNDDVAPSLTVIKHVVNNSGGTLSAGDFTMNVTATNPSDDSFPGNEAGTAISLNAGSFSVSETQQAGYAASYSTDCSGVIAVGQSKTCTVTNDDIAPLLTVIKYVVNDNGGLLNVSDFALYVDSTQVTSGVPNVFNAGSYTVSETNKPGYTAGSWGGDCATTGAITLSLGGNYTCTITNNDQPGKLIVKKVVINDNGGVKKTEDFSFSVNGGQAISFEADGQNDLPVNAGTYSVNETTPTGYSVSYDNCNQVVVANGETKTCTITNDDIQPKLTVTKVVTNDNGGTAVVSDFPLFVDATGVTSGVQNGFNAGSYVVSETNKTGYTGTISGDCDAQGNVTLAVGDQKSCTITNNDVAPLLTVIKYVTNDNGGLLNVSDFALYVDSTHVTSGVPNVFAAGNHTVSEVNQPGYTAGTWGGDCAADGDITLAVGGNYTCYITNNDQPGTLIVKKVVVNDNGGTKAAKDFSFSVNGGQAVSFEADGQNDLPVNAGTYSVTETTPTGYTVSYENCDDVTVANGQTQTCTITNNDIAPKLTIKKQADPESAQDFSFTSGQLGNFALDDDNDATLDNSKDFPNLSAGSYDVTETATPNWDLVYVDCRGTDDYTVLLDDGKLMVNLALGDDVTCTFINQERSSITGHKFEDKNKNGQWDQGEPTLSGWTITLTPICEDEEEDCSDATTISDVTDQSGAFHFDGLLQGLYRVCEVQQAGWVQTLPGQDGICWQVDVNEPGKECVVDFGNFKNGEVKGVKFNDVNGNGKRDASEPTLKDWTINLYAQARDNSELLAWLGTPVKTTKTDASGAYSFGNLATGTYKVCEVQQTNWTQTFPTTNGGCHEFTINESGQVITADFGNKAKPQVLGEQLVNTGSPTAAGTLLGLSMLIAVAASYVLTTRRKATNK